MRILWAENHARFVEIGRRHFLAGHDLTVVPSVGAALAALGSTTFDVALVDFDHDDGKGTRIIPLAKERGTKVIAVSSHDDGNAALLAAGADAACPKTRFAEIGAVLALTSSRG